MKTLLIAIAKNENRYLKEWIDYHYNIGFDQIIVCDNNDINGEVIFDDRIIVENFRGKHKERHLHQHYWGIQEDAYNYCLNKYQKDYDWIAFLDIDEFLYCETDLKEYLSTIDNSVGILYMSWEIFGDCEQLHYEDRPVQERFPYPTGENSKAQIRNPENEDFFKSFVRGRGMCKHMFVHHALTKGKAINTLGEEMEATKYMKYHAKKVLKHIWVKHYITKSVEEYFDRHYQRSSATGLEYHRGRFYFCKKRFFLINKWTPEKQEIVDKIVAERPIKNIHPVWHWIDLQVFHVYSLIGKFNYIKQRIKDIIRYDILHREKYANHI